MSKRTHSHDRDSANLNSPLRALQAATEAGLGPLLKRAQWLGKLDDSLRQSLPPVLAGQCRLANVDYDKLVFLVNAPVWKSKLRLHANLLLDAAAVAGLSVRSLVIKVAPAIPNALGENAGKPLSQIARDSLRATAQSLEDSELREQLMRLADLP